MWKKENTIVVKYFPNTGIEIDGIKLEWEKERKIVRQLLGNKHVANDSVTDLSKYYNGDTKYNIVTRRDIYKGLKNTDCYFFLNYNEKEELRDLEVHKGCEIILSGISISFNAKMKKVVSSLQSISLNIRNTGTSEFYFRDLKLVIADEQKMGGNGNKIAYFYCTCDTAHLEKG